MGKPSTHLLPPHRWFLGVCILCYGKRSARRHRHSVGSIDPPQLKQHRTPASRLTPAGAWQHHQVSHSNVKRKKLVERAPYFPPRRHPLFFTYLDYTSNPPTAAPGKSSFPLLQSILTTGVGVNRGRPDMGSTGHATPSKGKKKQTDALCYHTVHLHLGYSVSRMASACPQE